MSEEDLPTRLREYGATIHLVRIALTERDIADPALPSFPAADKRKDPRYRWFASNYGPRAWELDALNPVTLRDRVRRAIEAYIDRGAWERCGKAEAAERETLESVLGQWKAARAS
jgi:hypothetical protein